MNKHPKTTLALLTVSLSLTLIVGCETYGQDEGDESTRAAEVDGRDDAQSLAGPERPEAGDDWKAWAQGRATDLSTARPELVQALDPARARPGRDGKLRLRGPWMADADAGALLVDGFVRADDPEHRAILADAMAHSEGVPAQVLIDLATLDPDATVRAAVAPQLWRLRSEAGADAINTALADADADVRLGAAVAASRHPQATELVDALVPRLDDASAEVRMASARALGSVGSPQQLDALEPLLADPDAQVRLVALRAAHHLDPAGAARLAVQHGLHEDADPSVARAAEKIDAAR